MIIFDVGVNQATAFMVGSVGGGIFMFALMAVTWFVLDGRKGESL